MADVAIKPGGNTKLINAAIAYPELRRQMRSGKKSYDWGYEYTVFFWFRIFFVALLLTIPLLLTFFSMYMFIGYIWILLVPAMHIVYKLNTSSRYSDVTAYKYYSKLKDSWTDHGLTFYTQVWNHDCDGKKHEAYSSWHTDYEKRFTNCEYCDKRIKELASLYESQLKVEKLMSVDYDGPLFESSQEFRKAIEEMSKSYELPAPVDEVGYLKKKRKLKEPR